ncbi:hypothetical protein ACOYW6_04945 [Parablastomonas sp. CN1-191]|uniref:hypothetical protein n=1 Tax=Parablastomonas sp. CN1-191 TaxID=3400908 RepID=UPI003BF85A7D
MKRVLLSAAALAAIFTSPAPAQEVQPQPSPAQTIVVQGRSLKDTEAALQACVARKCPPDQDVRASLAHAENQFISGRYDDARRTLKASLGRNRSHARAFPVEVSDLMRANGRIAEHLGEAKDFQLSTLDMRDTLKAAFGADDFRTLVAQVEVGDSRAKLGFPDEAERIFRDVEARALAAGQNRVATLASLRQVLLDQVRYEDGHADYWRARIDARLGRIVDHPLKGAEDFAMVGEVMRARYDRSGGKAGSTQALVARFLARGGANRPILLHSEPLNNNDRPSGDDANILARLAAPDIRNTWADIGFWIEADGRVGDLEVLRSSGDKGWLAPVAKNIRSRIYAPLRKDGDAAPGFYMVERYTLTARFSENETGTHLRRREPIPRIERIDLTPDPAPPTG